MMFFLGCHLMDPILQLQGVPERIIPLNKSTGYEGILEYKNGVSYVKNL